MIMLKKILPYIILAIGVWIIYSLVFTRYELKTDVLNYERMIQELEAKVDSLHSANNHLVFKIDTLNQEINKLDLEIGQQDKKIVTLKYKVNEKVNSVDSFNDDELTSARLALVSATRGVISQGLSLMGITALEEM